MAEVQQPAEFACGVCLEECSVIAQQLTTDCCSQHICQVCFDAHACRDDVVAAPAACPFCRCPSYRAHSIAEGSGQRSLDGIWDVHIKETSVVGSASHKIALSIDGGKGKYEGAPSREASPNHMEGGDWLDLAVGHTPSGKSFNAQQKISRLPLFLMGSSAVFLGHSPVEGRLHGRDRASFRTVVAFSDKRGDILEIHQEAHMMRRRSASI